MEAKYNIYENQKRLQLNEAANKSETSQID